MIDYRILDTTEQFEAAVDVEIAVWGVPDREAVPASLMRAIHAAGGLNLGAYDGDTMVAMSSAFPGLVDGLPILWSHATGVRPEYQRLNIGYELKHRQAAWARERGYTAIHWTFDPLQAGNAHFNLRRLSAYSQRYHVNFYGQMRDAINHGHETDRLEAVLPLLEAPSLRNDDSSSLLAALDGRPAVPVGVDGADLLLVEIPLSIRALSEEELRDWRLQSRSAFSEAFRLGYRAVDFARDTRRGAYVLIRQL